MGLLPLTVCHPRQLDQVFINILINACHAIDNQGEIIIKTWEKGKSIFISFSDTSCGIPSENLDKIFQPFFTAKEEGKGTGLGLSIAYEIINKHHGDIAIDSKPGIGTTFTIRIPVENNVNYN